MQRSAEPAGSGLVIDFNTTVTTIQAVITLYCLVLAMTRFVGDTGRVKPAPKFDYVGSILSATGLGVIVLGTL